MTTSKLFTTDVMAITDISQEAAKRSGVWRGAMASCNPRQAYALHQCRACGRIASGDLRQCVCGWTSASTDDAPYFKKFRDTLDELRTMLFGAPDSVEDEFTYAFAA